MISVHPREPQDTPFCGLRVYRGYLRLRKTAATLATQRFAIENRDSKIEIPMSLTPEQQQAVSGWVSAGDNLSAIQKKLRDQFQVSMTYMDVRFLVDDLNLALKDPAPKADASDVSKAAGAAKGPAAAGGAPSREAPGGRKGFLDKAKEKLGLGKEEESAPEPEFEDEPLEDGEAAAGTANVSVEVDKVTLIPGALASGTVKFSDGVSGKWIVDNMGRPGFTEISQPGYRPNPADAQAFMAELSRPLQQRGF
jgi:hypothetical protein